MLVFMSMSNYLAVIIVLFILCWSPLEVLKLWKLKISKIVIIRGRHNSTNAGLALFFLNEK